MTTLNIQTSPVASITPKRPEARHAGHDELRDGCSAVLQQPEQIRPPFFHNKHLTTTRTPWN